MKFTRITIFILLVTIFYSCGSENENNGGNNPIPTSTPSPAHSGSPTPTSSLSPDHFSFKGEYEIKNVLCSNCRIKPCAKNPSAANIFKGKLKLDNEGLNKLPSKIEMEDTTEQSVKYTKLPSGNDYFYLWFRYKPNWWCSLHASELRGDFFDKELLVAECNDGGGNFCNFDAEKTPRDTPVKQWPKIDLNGKFTVKESKCKPFNEFEKITENATIDIDLKSSKPGKILVTKSETGVVIENSSISNSFEFGFVYPGIIEKGDIGVFPDRYVDSKHIEFNISSLSNVKCSAYINGSYPDKIVMSCETNMLVTPPINCSITAERQN